MRGLADARVRGGLRQGVAATIEHEAALAGRGFASVVDLGANTGHFSALAARGGRAVLACERDAAALERLEARDPIGGDGTIQSLVVDLVHPTPASGWACRERAAFLDRVRGDVTLGLALVHHLAIGANIPLASIAETFARLAPWSVVEWVPKSDPQVVRMLELRDDVFEDYDRQGFERAFGRFFDVQESQPIAETERVIYLMKRREAPTGGEG